MGLAKEAPNVRLRDTSVSPLECHKSLDALLTMLSPSPNGVLYTIVINKTK